MTMRAAVRLPRMLLLLALFGFSGSTTGKVEPARRLHNKEVDDILTFLHATGRKGNYAKAVKDHRAKGVRNGNSTSPAVVIGRPIKGDKGSSSMSPEKSTKSYKGSSKDASKGSGKGGSGSHKGGSGSKKYSGSSKDASKESSKSASGSSKDKNKESSKSVKGSKDDKSGDASKESSSSKDSSSGSGSNSKSKGKKSKSKKGKGGGKEEGGGGQPAPTNAPTLPPPPVAAPSLAPVSSPIAPPISGPVTLQLSPYYLFYEIVQSRIPSLDDFAGLAVFTEDYLHVYFQVVFSEIIDVSYSTSTTVISGSEFRLGEPVRVDYDTTITFAADSTQIPTVAEVDAILASAFEGSNGDTYVDALIQGLDESNIFKTTSSISFKAAPPQTSSRSTSSGKNAGIAAGAAAGSFILLIAGVALYCRKDEDERQIEEKSQVVDGVTVAGETFVGGETTDTRSRYRYDGEASLEGELPEDVVVHRLSRFRFLRAHYARSNLSSEAISESEAESPEERRKRMEDVTF